jgi:hypothetical protein
MINNVIIGTVINETENKIILISILNILNLVSEPVIGSLCVLPLLRLNTLNKFSSLI